jgi:hypothetical protein
MFDDAVCEGSPNLLRPKDEIVCGWIKSTGAVSFARGKFATKFLRWKRAIRSPNFEASENSSTN